MAENLTAKSARGSIQLIGGLLIVTRTSYIGEVKAQSTTSLSNLRGITFRDAGVLRDGLLEVHAEGLSSTTRLFRTGRDTSVPFTINERSPFWLMRDHLLSLLA